MTHSGENANPRDDLGIFEKLRTPRWTSSLAGDDWNQLTDWFAGKHNQGDS